jgi:hypothetical protein
MIKNQNHQLIPFMVHGSYFQSLKDSYISSALRQGKNDLNRCQV